MTEKVRIEVEGFVFLVMVRLCFVVTTTAGREDLRVLVFETADFLLREAFVNVNCSNNYGLLDLSQFFERNWNFF